MAHATQSTRSSSARFRFPTLPVKALVNSVVRYSQGPPETGRPKRE
jgi:hypothetical protein